MNPFGQVPVLQDDDLTLADSNAILVYLRDALRRTALAGHRPGGRGPRAALAVRGRRLNSGYGPGRARVAVLFRKPLDLAPLIAQRARRCSG